MCPVQTNDESTFTESLQYHLKATGGARNRAFAHPEMPMPTSDQLERFHSDSAIGHGSELAHRIPGQLSRYSLETGS